MFKTVILIFAAIAVALSAKKQFRVINGENVGHMLGRKVVNTREFPYLVRVVTTAEVKINGDDYITKDRCGGALLRMDVVITAAHCLMAARKPENVVAGAGIVNLVEPSNTGHLETVRKIVRHEGFISEPSPTKPNHDIALLFLEHSFTPSPFIRDIDPPEPTDYVLNKKALTAGFGLNENGNRPEWLQKTKLRVIANNICQMFTNNLISKLMVCGLNQADSTSLCDGDSGGPLVYNGRLIGISSWIMGGIKLPNGKRSCDPKKPSVFTRVGPYIRWINNHLRSNRQVD